MFVHRLHHRISLLVALFASALPATGLAHSEPQGFYVTLYGQSSRLSATSLNESGPQGLGDGLRAEFDGGTGFGGDLGWRYGNGWAAELEWNYRRHGLRTLQRAGTRLADEGDFASNTLWINGLRRFPTTSGWTPYVGAGIGWVQEIDIDIKTGPSDTERSYSANHDFAIQSIVGVEYALTRQWRLNADARWWRMGSVQLKNEAGNPDGQVGPLRYNPLSVQVGLRYSF